MSDLISRAEAKQAIRDRFPNLADRLEINNVLNSVPSADAVEVVRCKDCKHLKTMCEDEGTCYYWCKHWNNATDDWGHCYYGERREP